MLTFQQTNEIRERIERILKLAREIEAVPNFGPDLWTMRKMDQKCQVIRGDCQAIGVLVGTGDVLRSTNLPPGAKVIAPDAAAAVQRHIQRISALAVAIEEVPNFGPDIWSMRKIDDECRQIAWHVDQAWRLLNPQHT
jgi:hypothetical protein